MRQKDVKKILEIGISLSAEKNFNRLLENILSRVMELANCDAGTLYLLDGEDLRFKIMRNHTMKTYMGGDGTDPGLPPVKLKRENVCALSVLEGKTINIEDVRNCEAYDFSGPIRYDAMTGYRSKSMLVVPLENREGEKIGVLQLINHMDADGRACRFPEDVIPMVESVASQAAVTIQNARYVEDIRGLFQSFVKVMSSAVDERTPYNGSHTRHMAEYGARFVEFLNETCVQKGEAVWFSPAQKDELLMSIWLHDIGKLVTPLEVMNKEARLTPGQHTEFTHRMEQIGLLSEICMLRGQCPEADHWQVKEKIRQVMALVDAVNTAGFVGEDRIEELKEAAALTFTGPDGKVIKWLSEEEYGALTIRKGTLSEAERKIMESHVLVTDKLLSKIRFSKDLSHVREWAASHHEYLDGSGYPKGLSGAQIPREVRIITILDIFDALVADDRPYKPGMPVERALSILTAMAEKEGKLDSELTKLFVKSRCWEGRRG